MKLIILASVVLFFTFSGTVLIEGELNTRLHSAALCNDNVGVDELDTTI